MFDISSLQYNTEYPGLLSVLITVSFSMVLGVILAFTYDRTSRNVNRPDYFLHAIILIAIVASIIILAIGDSVARGLGMIGALSIIRFRTTIRNPRNIVFMFSAIAVGIASGVFAFVIAVVGTLAFSFSAFILYYSSFNPSKNFVGKIKLDIDVSLTHRNEIEEILHRQTLLFQLKKGQLETEKGLNFYSLSYDFKVKDKDIVNVLIKEFSLLQGVIISKLSIELNKSDVI